MLKTKYPVVDYSLCVECGTCVRLCPYMVFEKKKYPVPDVNDPEACYDPCHGCGKHCPEHAITYVGDNTGWTPTEGGGGCGCGQENCQ
ncbi:MAG: 4Fe-4S dicluster domain-containing protein [Oscillospiraceae bacterium]